MSTMALELEAIPEYEDELELEWEGELESEEFFRQLASENMHKFQIFLSDFAFLGCRQ